MLTKVKRKKAKAISMIMLIAYCLLPIASSAQCAMCRASLESTGNKTKVEAVNDGIVFLMAVPYVLVAIVGFVIYKMYSEKKAKI
jgi:hypothetical protein